MKKDEVELLQKQYPEQAYLVPVLARRTKYEVVEFAILATREMLNNQRTASPTDDSAGKGHENDEAATRIPQRMQPVREATTSRVDEDPGSGAPSCSCGQGHTSVEGNEGHSPWCEGHPQRRTP